jgi:hypothetical protein
VIKVVVLTERAKKDLRAMPTQVLDKFEAWVQLLEAIIVEEVRASVPYDSTAHIARSTS